MPFRHVGIESALKLVASTVLKVQAGLALPEQASLLEANTGAWGVASSEREPEQHLPRVWDMYYHGIRGTTRKKTPSGPLVAGLGVGCGVCECGCRGGGAARKSDEILSVSAVAPAVDFLDFRWISLSRSISSRTQTL